MIYHCRTKSVCSLLAKLEEFTSNLPPPLFHTWIFLLLLQFFFLLVILVLKYFEWILLKEYGNVFSLKKSKTLQLGLLSLTLILICTNIWILIRLWCNSHKFLFRQKSLQYIMYAHIIQCYVMYTVDIWSWDKSQLPLTFNMLLKEESSLQVENIHNGNWLKIKLILWKQKLIIIFILWSIHSSFIKLFMYLFRARYYGYLKYEEPYITLKTSLRCRNINSSSPNIDS